VATEPQVKAKLSIDTTNYERNLDRAAKATGAVDDAQQDLEASANRSKAAWVALGTAMTVAGAKMIGTLKSSIDAASALNESTSKAGVVFEDSAKQIDAFASAAAENLGMSSRAAYDAASMMALFGKSAGLTGKELVGFSTELVGLSSDLASFFDTSPEDAMQAIGSALRGETESIRRYNVLLDAATLQQRAFKMGLTETTKQALTPQQKVLAAHQEILAQTGDAQGDFARTSDGFANSQRQMTAAMEDAKAALGEGLLPMMARGAEFLAAWARQFAELPGPVRAAIAVTGGLVASFALLSPAITASVQGFKMLKDAFRAYRGAALTTAAANDALAASQARVSGARTVAASAGSLGPAAAAVAAAATVLTGAVLKLNQMRADHLADTVNDLTDAVEAGKSFGEAMSAPTAGLDGIGELFEFLNSEDWSAPGRGVALSEIAQQFRAVDQALADMEPEDAADAFLQLALEAGRAGMSVHELLEATPKYVQAQEDAGRAAWDWGDAEAAKAEEAMTAADAIKEQKDRIDALTDSMWAGIDTGLAMVRSDDKLIGQKKRLKEALKEKSKSLDESTEAGRRNRDMIYDEIDAITENAELVYRKAILDGKTAPEALEKSVAALVKNKEELVKNAKKAGLAKNEVQKLVDKYLDVPEIVETTIKVNAEVNDKALDAALNKLNNSDLARIYSVGGAATGGKIGGRGTSTSDSNLMALSRGEWVINAAAARKFGDGFMAAINAGQLPYAASAPAGGDQPSALVGTVNVYEQTPTTRVGVLDALAETAYRQGMVR